ncbi:hypothetical protein [Paraburkholderia phenazinium]|uniref:Uncharacterized protein n=1 Tax=Paraburkholderia phenazinium TaxID=60549 RepID=A0A1N6K981_9BURK|nr:hypothetical protein [Paraburkholderia phenazinium]SIO53128.1 hypothetical protein SAMN05444168_6467 [Paraburkholderia phenazinium]
MSACLFAGSSWIGGSEEVSNVTFARDPDSNQFSAMILKLVDGKPKLVYILIQYKTDGDNGMVHSEAFSAFGSHAREGCQAS